MRKFHCQAQSAQKVKMRHCFLQRGSVFETPTAITRRGCLCGTWIADRLFFTGRGSNDHGTRIARIHFWSPGRGSRGCSNETRIAQITSGFRGADHADRVTGRGWRGCTSGLRGADHADRLTGTRMARIHFWFWDADHADPLTGYRSRGFTPVTSRIGSRHLFAVGVDQDR